jgi:FkbM family methyltransferase
MPELQKPASPRLPSMFFGDTAKASSPVVLFDVGCSGGIDDLWRYFGKNVTGVGFDPLVDEIDRLNANAPAGFRYEAAFVGCGDYPPEARPQHGELCNWPLERISATAYAAIKRMDYASTHFNAGRPVVHTERRVTLDAYAAQHGIAKVDFLKVDTDGHDIEVLLGATDVLRNGCLAVTAEVDLHGGSHPQANVFTNIDRLLREAGFRLFDLSAHRYTRTALPGRFLYDIPAQTVAGQVAWADVFYARDLAEVRAAYEPTADDVLKLTAILEVVGLQDCAAEILAVRRDLVAPVCDVDAALDALAMSAHGVNYGEHIATFQRDPDSLMPSRMVPPAAPPRRSFWRRWL